MEKQLYCGAARRKVNPWDDIIRRLHRKPERDVSFVDDLFLRVIAVCDGETKFLIIAYDSGYSCIDDQFAAIYERFGISSENVMVFDCHSHTKLYGGYQFGNLPPNPRKHYQEFYSWPQEEQDAMNEYGDFTRGQMLEAVGEALANLRPAKMGHAKGESYINVCRNQRYVIEQPDGSLKETYTIGVDPAAPIDHTVFVMRFDDIETGEPIAFFINYPVHNCVMIDNHSGENGKKAWSSDIGGNCSQFMEKKYPCCTAIWSSGPAGNINPIFGTEMLYPDPMTGAPTQMYSHGTELGIVMLKMLATRHFADIMDTVRKIRHMTDKTELKCAVEISETPGIDGDNVVHEGLYKVRMQMLRIGDVALLGLSGELYDSFGKFIREISPMKNTVLVTHVAIGTAQSEYILDDWAFEHSPSAGQRQKLGPRDGDAGRKGLATCIVGMEHTQIVSGYLKKSFKKHTLSLFDRIL
ncbi:MAG: hypothetical protein LBT14_06175 [Treponema sp.]|jgi:hypothetical protein|nr:hypothetical protein [Treponema sp.]